MFKIMCAVFDLKSELFHDPFCVPATGVAVRGFADEINNKEKRGDMQLHPEDFSLFEVGTYDYRVGLMVPHGQPKLLVRGSDSVIKG